MNEDEKWMQIAIHQALIANKKGEVPVGAIIVKNDKVIAKAHNMPISNRDPSAHAEILAIRQAGKNEQNYRLPNTTLYVTLEPCTMCLGAIMHARINRIVFGASDLKSGVCGSVSNLTSETYFNHKVEVNGGVLKDDCKLILQSFFQIRRK